MVNRIIQFVGVVALLAIGIATGFWLAWNANTVGIVIAQIGGIIPLIGALLFVAALIALAYFWPERWSRNLQGTLIIIAFIVSAFFVKDILTAVIAQASTSWWPVLGAILYAVGLWLAVTWAVYGQLLPRMPRIHIRRATAPAAPAAGA